MAERRLAYLGDEQGLGKTAQAIRVCQLTNAKRVLIVCPSVAMVNWQRELQAFADWTATIVRGKQTRLPDISIVSWDWVADHGGDVAPGAGWDVLIADEAHYAKNSRAARTKALLAFTYKRKGKAPAKGLVHYSRRVYALSGTAAPNHAGELWTWMRTLNATNMSEGLWYETFCVQFVNQQGFRMRTDTRSGAIPELRRIMEPVFLRRKKSDILTDLPPIWIKDLPIEGDHHDVEAVNALAETFGVTGDTIFQMLEKSASDIIALIQQHVDNLPRLRRLIGMAKVRPVAKLLTELLESKALNKVVLFAVHKEVIASLAEKLAQFGVVAVTGSTSHTDRQKAVDDFQNKQSVRVFIGNVQAAGVAITLTAAADVWMVESSWVPGDNAQCIARCHRIGQTDRVEGVFVTLTGTIDEAVTATLTRKAKLIAQIMQD